MKYIEYAYDPTIPDLATIKEGSIVIMKTTTDKFDYIGVVTRIRKVRGRKLLVTVDGEEHNINDVRKCYPAV